MYEHDIYGIFSDVQPGEGYMLESSEWESLKGPEEPNYEDFEN